MESGAHKNHVFCETVWIGIEVGDDAHALVSCSLVGHARLAMED